MIIPDDHALTVTNYVTANHNEIMSFTMGHWVDDTGTAPSGANDIANRWFDIWKNRMQIQTANEYTIQSVTAYWRQGTDLLVGVSDRAPYAGTLGVGAEPPAVSYLIRKNTGLAGRKYRGRLFAPQPRDVDVDAGGRILAARITSITPALAGLITDANDAGIFGWRLPLRLLHSDATAPTAISSLTCDPIVGTQRRRQR